MLQVIRAWVIMLAVFAWPPLVSAGDNADPEEKLRACVRDKAPAAKAAGLQSAGEAVEYFLRMCVPPTTLPLAGQGAPTASADPVYVPLPGIFRKVIREEWAAFLSRADRP